MLKQLKSYFYLSTLIALLSLFIVPSYASHNINEETNGKRPLVIGGKRPLPQPLPQNITSQPGLKKSPKVPPQVDAKRGSLPCIPQRTPSQELSQNTVKVAPRASTKVPSFIGEQRHSVTPQSQTKRGQYVPEQLLMKPQQTLQETLLKSLQARPDYLSPLIVEIKEALASLPDASKRALSQRESFLLETPLSNYSPLAFLRRKEKILTEVSLSREHVSFERLREIINYLEGLCKAENKEITSTLKASLQKLKNVYEDFIIDVCASSIDKRGLLLSSVPIDGEFFEEPFVIAQEQAYDLLSFDEYGIPFKNNLLGSSVVTKVEGIHAKSTFIKANQEGTLDPGMEWAVSTFHTMMFGEGIVPSSLLILKDVPHQKALPNTEAERLVDEAKAPQCSKPEKKKILNRLHEEEGLMSQFQRTVQSFAVQVTPHIEGIHLATFLEQALKDPSLWDTLDPYNVQSLLLTALLTAPNDAKGDNFMVIKEECISPNGSKEVRRKIIGIDNDRAFYPYIKAINRQAHLIDIRHILFCFPQVMGMPLTEEIKDDFLAHHPALFLLQWLKVLDEHNDKYQHLLTHGRIPQALFNTLHLPFKLKQGTITALLKRYTTLYDTLKLNHKADITPDQLLEALSPLTAQYYTKLRQEHGPLKAFDLIYKQSNLLEACFKEEITNSTLLKELEDSYFQKLSLFDEEQFYNFFHYLIKTQKDKDIFNLYLKAAIKLEQRTHFKVDKESLAKTPRYFQYAEISINKDPFTYQDETRIIDKRKIAILSYDNLVKNLKVEKRPILQATEFKKIDITFPVAFSRESLGKRITAVIDNTLGEDRPLYFAISHFQFIPNARSNLAGREGVPLNVNNKYNLDNISYMKKGGSLIDANEKPVPNSNGWLVRRRNNLRVEITDIKALELSVWAEKNDFNGIIWASFPPTLNSIKDVAKKLLQDKDLLNNTQEYILSLPDGPISEFENLIVNGDKEKLNQL